MQEKAGKTVLFYLGIITGFGPSGSKLPTAFTVLNVFLIEIMAHSESSLNLR